jgi:hypothetical protein
MIELRRRKMMLKNSQELLHRIKNQSINQSNLFVMDFINPIQVYKHMLQA